MKTLKQPPVTETMGHAYDGIQEYDNPLPGWWTKLFLGSIVFSVFYMLYFHAGADERSVIDQLRASEVALAKKQYGAVGELVQDRATLLRFVKDPDWVNYGRSIFKTNCQSCHGPDGGGLVGPNLADDRWKNIKHVEDIMTIINNGAAGNSMPAWKQRFSDQRDVIMVSAYVASLVEKAEKPAAQKAPEGAVTIASWDVDRASVPASEGAKPETGPDSNKTIQEPKP